MVFIAKENPEGYYIHLSFIYHVSNLVSINLEQLLSWCYFHAIDIFGEYSSNLL